MIRIVQNSAAGRAKSYFTSRAGEYYLDGQQELRGVWRGEAAGKLGLSGEIAKTDWDAICDGLNPKSGEKLLQRLKDNRTVGYDINFHVPKSVSVLYGLTRGDERLLNAFRESVGATMRDIERELKTRVRKNGKNEDRTTGNMVWGEFVHLTARPVDGKPDPHLHAHCFVLNTTWDQTEQKWKAGNFKDIKQDAPYFEALFHSRLSRKVAELGLPVERTRTGWEIAGVSRTLIDKFSRRTELIEETAKAKGIDDPAAKSELGARTRKGKLKDLTMPQLREQWHGRMTERELATMNRLHRQIGGKPVAINERAAERAMRFAIDHAFERRSVVSERRILATALKHAAGLATPEQVLRQADRSGLIVGERDGQRMATTREVLLEETGMLDWARRGRGTVRQLNAKPRKWKREWLNESQRAGVRHILESRDRCVVLRGVAGSGKTSLMGEVCDAIQESGVKLVPLAPTAEASRGVMRAEGFKDATTVAHFLTDKRMQRAAQGAVLWIDEAGLLGAKSMAQMFRLAEEIGARCILTGDRRQNPSVERGSVLHQLETEAGLKSAEVKTIQRQKEQYREAVKDLSEGRSAAGFAKLDKMGAIREIANPDERYRLLAADYADTVGAGKECLVVCPTHREGERVTAQIRRTLSERGQLGSDRRVFRVLQNAHLTQAQRADQLSYLPSDVLQFHQHARGYKRGQRIAAGDGRLPLDQARRFTVFRSRQLELAPGDLVRVTHNGWTKNGRSRLNNGAVYKVSTFTKSGDIVLSNGMVVAKYFGHLSHGFCNTAYAVQGKTSRHRVLIAQSTLSLPATSKEGFYVAASRAKESIAIYCDNREALKEAVGQSEERITAMELVNQAKARQVVELHRRQAWLVHSLERKREQELAHER
jgi:conjugative relaxase-like TrwC/TraI family protein